MSSSSGFFLLSSYFLFKFSQLSSPSRSLSRLHWLGCRTFFNKAELAWGFDESTSRPDSVISLSHWDSTCATIFTAFLWQLSTQVLNLYHQLSQVPDAPVNLSGLGMPFNSDLSLYWTDLSTFLLICSCWFIASVIAWFSCAWPWVSWAIICITIWDMLGPLVCPCAGAGGVPGCWGGCCCWAILSRSSGALRPDSREPLGTFGDALQGYESIFGFSWFSGAWASTFSSWHEVSAPELNQLGVDTYTFTAGYQNLSSATMNREFGLLNLMNTPEHCSAPFHSVSSKLAETAKMTKMV